MFDDIKQKKSTGLFADLTQPKKKVGFFQDAIQDIKQGGNELKKSISSIDDKFRENQQFLKTKTNVRTPAPLSALKAGLQTVSEVGGTLLSTPVKVLTPQSIEDKISSKIQGAVKRGVESETGRKTIETVQKLPAETKFAISLNTALAETLPFGVATKPAATAVKSGINVAKDGINIAQKSANDIAKESVSRLAERANSKVANTIEKNVFVEAPQKTAGKIYREALESGINPMQVVKERGLSSQIKTTSDGKINTRGAVEALENEIVEKSTKFNRVLDAYSNQGVGVAKKDFLQEIINGMGRQINDPSIQKKLLRAEEIINDYYRTFGTEDVIPLSKVQEIKKALYKSSSAYSKSGAPDFDDIGAIELAARAANRSIEKELSDPRMLQINKELQKLIETSNILERIDGNALRGGRLGKMVNQTAGAILFGAAGSTLGPLGTLGAGVTGAFVGDALAKLGFNRQIGGSVRRRIAQMKEYGVSSDADNRLDEVLGKLEAGEQVQATDFDEIALKRLQEFMLQDRAQAPVSTR